MQSSSFSLSSPYAYSRSRVRGGGTTRRPWRGWSSTHRSRSTRWDYCGDTRCTTRRRGTSWRNCFPSHRGPRHRSRTGSRCGSQESRQRSRSSPRNIHGNCTSLQNRFRCVIIPSHSHTHTHTHTKSTAWSLTEQIFMCTKFLKDRTKKWKTNTCDREYSLPY